MTQALNRLRQSGSMFHIPESQLVVDPFEIPAEWPRVLGIAIESSGVAAIWGARDPSGATYLFAEHQLSHPEPSENALAIKKQGDWIPGILSASSVSGSQATRNSVAEIYRGQGW
jgi:hypothetical protein